MFIDVYTIVNWAGVFYYGVTLLMSCSNLYHINCSGGIGHSFDRRKSNKALVNLILILMAALAVNYIILEIDWILSDYGEDIGGVTDMLWSLHEYFVATVYVLINMFISSRVKWRRRYDD